MRAFSAMTNNDIKRLLEAQEALRQLEPFSGALKAFEESASLRRLVQDANRHQEAMRVLLGPLDELYRADLVTPALPLARELEGLRTMLDEIQTRFRLPEIVEATKLFRDWESSTTTSAIRRYQEQASAVQSAIEGMRVPWLDIQDELRSIKGFAELQGIGYALRTMPAFDTHLADAIRIDLGDWRDKLAWPSEIFTDSLARAAFYAARGFDAALTTFPAAAFAQSISIAGLRDVPPPLISAYYVEPEAEEKDEQEAGFERTNAAHDRLQRFESQVRKFIDETMRAAFGEEWTKHQVPGDIRKAWIEKRGKAKDGGEPEWPIIAYADFTDYVPIITRKDNWKKAFEPIFWRPAFVQESFQRLYPIRVCTMHGRLITQDDELYLYVETKRLLAAIGIKP